MMPTSAVEHRSRRRPTAARLEVEQSVRVELVVEEGVDLGRDVVEGAGLAAVDRSSTVLGHDCDHPPPRQPPPPARRLVGAEAGDVVDPWHPEALAALDAVGHEAPGEHGGVGEGEATGEAAPALGRAHPTGVDRPAVVDLRRRDELQRERAALEQAEQIALAEDGGRAAAGRRWIEHQRRDIDVRRVDRTADHHGEVGHQQTSGEQCCRRRERGRHADDHDVVGAAFLGQRPAHAPRRAAVRGLGAGGRP